MPPYPGILTEMQRRRWMVLVLTSVGFFMGTLDSTVVAVALPSIGPSLRLSYSEALWIQAAYLLAISIFLVPIGRLADRHGRTRFYMTGTALFALFSFACGFAFNGTSLIVARALQGASAAFMSATSTALVTSVFPTDQKKGGLPLGLIAAGYTRHLGPVVWLFATHVDGDGFSSSTPIALLNLVSEAICCRQSGGIRRRSGGQKSLQRGDGRPSQGLVPGRVGGKPSQRVVPSRVGWAIVATLGPGLTGGGVVVRFDAVRSNRIFDLRTLLGLVEPADHRSAGGIGCRVRHLHGGGAEGAGSYARPDRDPEKPLLFMATTGAALLSYMAGFGVTTFTAVFLEIVEGYSAQHTGLILLTQPIFMVVLSGVFGRLSDRGGNPAAHYRRHDLSGARHGGAGDPADGGASLYVV